MSVTDNILRYWTSMENDSTNISDKIPNTERVMNSENNIHSIYKEEEYLSYTLKGSEIGDKIKYLLNCYPTELSFYSVLKNDIIKYYKTIEQLIQSINDILDFDKDYIIKQSQDNHIILITNDIIFIDSNIFEL